MLAIKGYNKYKNNISEAKQHPKIHFLYCVDPVSDIFEIKSSVNSTVLINPKQKLIGKRMSGGRKNKKTDSN